MSITTTNGNIEIDSGYATGSATGGTINTLTGTGFSTLWPSRIIYLTGGTGSGQSRCVQSSTSTTITTYEDWATQPDNTTTFTISYDVTDLVAESNCDYIGDSDSKIVGFSGGNIIIKSGGVFGGVKNTLIFLTDRKFLEQDLGGFWQFGMKIDGRGREGGGITTSNHTDYIGYIEIPLKGTTRLFGVDWDNKMQGTTFGENKLSRINQTATPQELTAYDSDFRDIVLLEDAFTDTANCNFIGERSGLMTFEPTINSFGHKLFSGILSPRDGTNNLNGADGFDLSYFGDAPIDDFFNTPVFLYQFDAEYYYWNTTFPAGYAAAFRWHAGFGEGTIFEGYSVKPIIQNSSGSPISGVNIALEDKNGNAGWTTGKDASFNPTKTLTLVSDSDGTITNSIGTGENGLIINNDWTRVSMLVSSAVSYYPFKLYVKKYGIVPIKKTNLYYTTRFTELLSGATNARLASTEVEAAAITGIALNFATKAITITQDTKSQDLFDYFHYQLAQTVNSTADDDIFLNDFVDIGSWSLTLDGCTYTGAVTTTDVITLSNGAKATGNLVDVNGTRFPDRIISLTNLVVGSRLYVFDTTNNNTLFNEVATDPKFNGTVPTDGTDVDLLIRVRNASGAIKYKQFLTEATLTSSNVSITVNQPLDQ